MPAAIATEVTRPDRSIADAAAYGPPPE